MILLYPHINKLNLDTLSENFFENLMKSLGEIEEAPSLMIEVYACLVGVDPNWIIKNVSVYEVVTSFNALAEVNGNLIALIREALMGMVPLRKNG